MAGRKLRPMTSAVDLDLANIIHWRIVEASVAKNMVTFLPA